ncbi:hypothetical protein tf_26 [Pseudomonas phage tf]|uniref:Uncharacterized protein n=1 Tax=Pseudomonas phage tf TaxID=1114179 RepID=I2FLP9_9CAUD|nr:hypothetical protein tf_26 [Pseudomonas phage tf]CCE60783.1 hypothetical protein tf_26 [Pseudomonas phage tf]
MTVATVTEAVKVYRDSPNTYGHESNDELRRELKTLMGANASQVHLQESIKSALGDSEAGYVEESLGIRHLWERLKAAEDILRAAEGVYGEKIAALPCMTIPGSVHCVPSIAIQLMKMEANKPE